MAPAPNQKDEVIGLTKGDLLQLIQELRKPVKTEKELRDEAQAETDRKAMAETLKQNQQNKMARQQSCSHMRANGSTTAVYVVDLNKLYCQACSKWIAPAESELFNKLYQLAI